jgi:hypothetical protein
METEEENQRRSVTPKVNNQTLKWREKQLTA